MWTPIRGPDWMPITPKMGSLFGSDPLLVTIGSPRAGDARLEQIEFSAPIHLTLNQLELANLTLGLAIRPTRRDRGAHRGLVLRDAVHECRNENSCWRARSKDRVRPTPFFGSWLGNRQRFRAPRPEARRRSQSRRRLQSRPSRADRARSSSTGRWFGQRECGLSRLHPSFLIADAVRSTR